MDQELERLLKEMTEELKDLVKVLGGTSKSLIQNTKANKQELAVRQNAIRILREQKKLAQDNNSLTDEQNQEIEDSIKSLEEFQKKAKASGGVMGLLSRAIGKVVKFVGDVLLAGAKTALAFSDTRQSIGSFEDAINAGIGEIDGIGPVARELAREIDSNVEAFTQLSKTGATFGSSIVMLRKAAADAAIPLPKFTDLIASNTTLLARLFGTVDRGVPQIVGLTERLRTLTEQEFAKFGLTLDDTSGFLTTFLELERARGNTTRFTQAQLLGATKDYTKNLVILSKLTGRSVDELDAQNKAAAADGVFRSQLADMAGEDAALLTANINTLPPALQQLAKEIVGLGAPVAEASQDLEAISGGRFGEAIRQFQSDLDPVAFQNAIKEISGDAMRNGAAFGDAALAGGRFTEALNAIAASIGTAVDRADLEGEINAIGDNIVNLRNATSAFDRLASDVQKARFDLLTPLLYENSEAVVRFSTAFLDKLGNLASEEGALAQFGNALKGFSKTYLGIDFDQPDPTIPNTKFPGNITQSNEKFSDKYFKVPFTNMLIEKSEGSLGEADVNLDDFDKRQVGTLGATGMLSEPENIITSVEKGERVLSPAETDAVNNIDFSKMESILNSMLESSKNNENQLNRLVAVNTMTEKNTKDTNKNLANMSGSLV